MAGEVWPPPEWDIGYPQGMATPVPGMAPVSPAPPAPPVEMPPPVAPELAGLGPDHGAADEPWPPPGWADEPVGPETQFEPDPVRPPEPGPDAISGADEPRATAKQSQARDEERAHQAQPKNTTAQGYQASPTDEYIASLEREGHYAARQAEAEAEGKRAEADQRLRDAEAMRIDEQRRRSDAQMEWQRLQAERINLANTTIDDKAWQKRQNVGSGLAFMLGAALAGLQGATQGTRGNAFLEMADQEINRDIETQKANLMNRHQALGQGMSLYGQLLQTHKDERVADEMMRAVRYDAIAAQALAESSKYMSPVVQERGRRQAMEARMQADAAIQNAAVAAEEKEYKRRMDAEELRLKQSANARAWAAEKRAALGQAADTSFRAAELGMKAAQLANGPPRNVAAEKHDFNVKTHEDKRTIPGGKTTKGKKLLVVDERDAPALRDKMTQVTSMWQKFDRLEEIYARNGWKPFREWSVWDPKAQEDLKEARLTMGLILPEYSKANDQGVIRDSEYPMYAKMFGDPAGLLDPRTNFRRMREMSVQTINNELEQKAVNQDAAWWTPTPVTKGNGETITTSKEQSEAKKEAASELDSKTPRPGWEPVGQSPDGTKQITADNVVIPAGRHIVAEQLSNDGSTLYTLDDGSSFSVADDEEDD